MEQNGWFKIGGAHQPPARNREGIPIVYPQKKQPEINNAPEPAPPPAPSLPKYAEKAPQKKPVVSKPEVPMPDPCGDELKVLHSQTVGERGPVLAQDGILHEVLETFVHAKAIERAVHVKGFGAFGHFQPYRSMREYTKLGLLQDSGKKTQVACRFSLGAGNKGTPDTSRNIRGFSTKFYTEQGIFDLLCNHLPVFLLRDAIRVPEAFKSLQPSPVNNLSDPGRFWDFVACTPEATHFITWLYSDAGTVKSLRHIRAYGVNTYVWRNEDGERHYVKYHWLPMAGEEYIDRGEAARLACSDPDIAGRDLYDTIAAGTPVEYELRVQLMDPEDLDQLSYDPLDDTKIWDEEVYPLLPVGRLVLDRNPKDYDAQTERITFSPANLLEGVELSEDKMLQGRSFVYWDAQRRRLGPEFRSLPINSQKDWSPDEMVTSGSGLHTAGKLMRASIPDPDNFTQAGDRYHSLSDTQKDHLADNIASELYAVSDRTRKIVMSYFTQASEEFALNIERQMEKYTDQMNRK